MDLTSVHDFCLGKKKTILFYQMAPKQQNTCQVCSAAQKCCRDDEKKVASAAVAATSDSHWYYYGSQPKKQPRCPDCGVALKREVDGPCAHCGRRSKSWFLQQTVAFPDTQELLK